MSNRLLIIARHPVTRAVLHCAALCAVEAVRRISTPQDRSIRTDGGTS
ncbi:hypothetical protein ACFXNW_02180 [Nocardia sp. NPDC059180]